ncbi:MAG TPA: 16S rRNA (uracil(1498)-N(3))-methyltransferase [Geopsychrobacteraceae bacterium]|nr:16S rRNA (uracil(1498)-N(3))-methyltransferase [Geopsychrobacteraceae bacterium]
MRRFFLPETAFQPATTVELSPELLKHIRNVLRLNVGEDIELLDGSGTIARCRLNALSTKSGTALVLSTRVAPSPPLIIELIQGTAKGVKLDMVLQKGTELGASRFILSATERSIGRLKEERLTAKLERWKKITQEAARQCQQTHLPTISATSSLTEAINNCHGQLKLMLWEEETQPLSLVLPDTPPKAISVLVGPEGGLTSAEANVAKSAGFKSVRLGPRILRTETAGLAIISILQYLYGDIAADISEE